MPKIIDLDQLYEAAKVKIELPEHDDDRRHRLHMQARQQDWELVREKWLFAFGLIFVALIGALAILNIATTPQSPSPWATSVLTALVSGLLGYLVGRKDTKPRP